jgi:hypothetical protein
MRIRNCHLVARAGTLNVGLLGHKPPPEQKFAGVDMSERFRAVLYLQIG